MPNGDPRWVACRAQPVTEFMRAAQGLIRGETAGQAEVWLYEWVPSDPAEFEAQAAMRARALMPPG